MADPPLLVRHMTRQDIPAVLALDAELFPCPYTERIIAPYLEGHCLALLLVDATNSIIGVSTVRRSWKSFWTTDRRAYLSTLGIRAGFRRRGLATDLLRLTCQSLRDHHQTVELSLDVQQSNEGAIAFYTRFGFRILQSKWGYYEVKGSRSDGFLMGMDLTPELNCAREDEIVVDEAVMRRLQPRDRQGWMASLISSP